MAHDVDKAHNTSRLEALTDGVYAIIMTLLAFDIRLPDFETEGVRVALLSLGPIFLTYFVSFALLGVYWTSHRNQFNHIVHIDQTHRWINIFFLCFSALIPFTAELLSRFPNKSFAVVIFGLNLSLISLLLYWSWVHATSGHRLVDKDLSEQIIAIGRHRSLFLLGIYALAILLGFIVPWVSLLLYAVVPLIYMFPVLTKLIHFK